MGADVESLLLTALTTGLATAALSVTISRASITAPLREWVFSKSERVGHLISCDYCTSHWVAALVVFLALGGQPTPTWPLVFVLWAASIGVSTAVVSLMLWRQ